MSLDRCKFIFVDADGNQRQVKILTKMSWMLTELRLHLSIFRDW